MCARYEILVFLCFLSFVTSDTVKRDLIGPPPPPPPLPPGLDFLQLGHFGPISRLPSHPSFVHLGLTPQQAIGFITILLENGFLNANVLKLANGKPFLPIPPPPFFGPQFGGNVYGPPIPTFDPYFFYILTNFAKYLPYGLGSQGIYGSTGLPKIKPLPDLGKYSDKN